MEYVRKEVRQANGWYTLLHVQLESQLQQETYTGCEFISFTFTECVFELSSEESTLTLLTEVRRRMWFKESLVLHNMYY